MSKPRCPRIPVALAAAVFYANYVVPFSTLMSCAFYDRRESLVE